VPDGVGGERFQAGPSGRNRTGLRRDGVGSTSTVPDAPRGRTATGRANRFWDDAIVPTGPGAPDGQATPTRNGSAAGKRGGGYLSGAPGQAIKSKAAKVGYATGLQAGMADDGGAVAETRDSKMKRGQVNRFDYYADARK
jgi:hypothetical protein